MASWTQLITRTELILVISRVFDLSHTDSKPMWLPLAVDKVLVD